MHTSLRLLTLFCFFLASPCFGQPPFDGQPDVNAESVTKEIQKALEKKTRPSEVVQLVLHAMEMRDQGVPFSDALEPFLVELGKDAVPPLMENLENPKAIQALRVLVLQQIPVPAKDIAKRLPKFSAESRLEGLRLLGDVVLQDDKESKSINELLEKFLMDENDGVAVTAATVNPKYDPVFGKKLVSALKAVLRKDGVDTGHWSTGLNSMLRYSTDEGYRLISESLESEHLPDCLSGFHQHLEQNEMALRNPQDLSYAIDYEAHTRWLATWRKQFKSESGFVKKAALAQLLLTAKIDDNVDECVQILFERMRLQENNNVNISWRQDDREPVKKAVRKYGFGSGDARIRIAAATIAAQNGWGEFLPDIKKLEEKASANVRQEAIDRQVRLINQASNAMMDPDPNVSDRAKKVWKEEKIHEKAGALILRVQTMVGQAKEVPEKEALINLLESMSPTAALQELQKMMGQAATASQIQRLAQRVQMLQQQLNMKD